MTSLKFQASSRRTVSYWYQYCLTRRFVVERVTRIELAWPAWKVAVAARTRVILDGEMSSGDTVIDHI